jgi:glycosyltransferase involved in cell wall biosynthesis
LTGTVLADVSAVTHPSRVPIALFMSTFVPGGTENQMIELARRLDRSRFEVHLACFHRSGPWLRRAEERAATVAEFPISGFLHPGTLGQMRAFARWCRETRIAIVHTTDLYANIFGLPAARLAGVPVRIGNRREVNPDKSAALIALQRLAYSHANRVVANSRAAADRLARERVDPRRISIVANGIDLAVFQPRPARERLRRIVTVANLRPEKAHEILIDAAAIVLRQYADAEFWIVGGGVRLEEITRLAHDRGVGAQTRFFGHRDDVPQLLAECDLFALPSRSEAMPNGVVEAMAAGLPIVATAVGGVPELLSDRRTGVLVQPDDPQAFAAALMDLMESPDRAAALGRAAREAVQRRFSFDRMVNEFEQIYLSELQVRAPKLVAGAELLAS